MLQTEKYSKRWRRFDIATGIIIIIFSAIVIASPMVTALTLTFFLAIGLLAVGIGMIGVGVTAASRALPKWLRAYDVAVGAIAIIASIIFLSYPTIAILSAIVLLSIGLLFRGIWGIAAGITVKRLPIWYRAMLVWVGVLTLAASGIVISSPAAAFLALKVLLSFSLLINGIENIISGVSGSRLPRYYGADLQIER